VNLVVVVGGAAGAGAGGEAHSTPPTEREATLHHKSPTRASQKERLFEVGVEKE
jgi:hypothetical protein